MIPREGGTVFDDVDVAHCYHCRPPYPKDLIQRLFELAPGMSAALDLGCGPGKLAVPLSAFFLRVDAVDPSQPMLDEAAHVGVPNVRWIHGTAEDAPLEGPYDLVTAGASVHWMDHGIVFPRLAALAPAGRVAVIEGDDAYEPPWEGGWIDLIRRWLERLGGGYDPSGHDEALLAYERWLDIEGREPFLFSFEQSVRDFITCQHSRYSFARARMGEAALEFDAELEALLAPHAPGGLLHFQVETRLTWGRARAGARAAASL